jgi:nucleoside-diphosphate-sugar epimerase
LDRSSTNDARLPRGLIGRRVLLCGASGFLGSALRRRLALVDVEIHGISRMARVSTPQTRWWQGDLAQPTVAARIVKEVRPDVIFNLSGIPDARPARDRVLPTFLGNALSTVNLLLAISDVGCNRFIHCGSRQEPGAGSTMALAASPYALSKGVESQYIDLFRRLYGMPTTTLYLSIVYGPGDTTRHLIPYVVTSLLRDEAPRLSSGIDLVDWLHVEDAVDAFIAAAEADGVIGQSFDVGSGDPVSVRDVVEHIVELIGSRVQPMFGALPDRPPAVLRSVDPLRLGELLGWRPRMPLNEGLKQTIEWYRHNLRVDHQSSAST